MPGSSSGAPAPVAGEGSRLHGWLQRLVLVEPAETGVALWAFLYHLCLFVGYGILRPVREEMGVLVGNLPWLYVGTFVTVLAAQPLYARLVARLPRRRFIPLVYRFLALNLLAFFVLWKLGSEDVRLWTGRAYYVWVSAYILFAVSVFWSLMADVFTNAQGRRLFGFLAAGASLGQVIGSAIPSTLAQLTGPMNLLLVSVLFLELSVLCVRRLCHAAESDGVVQGPVGAAPAPRAATEEPIGGTILGGLARVARSPYLLGICAFIFLMTLASTFLYFIQRDLVRAASDDSGVRTSIFGWMDFCVSSLALLTQVFLTGRVIRRLGVGTTLLALPAITAVGFLGLSLAPTLIVLFVFQVFARASRYALAKPAREVLFTVVGREEKYKSKNFVDTAVYRGGDVANAWLFALLQTGVGLSLSAISLVAVPVAGLWGAVAWQLGRAQDRRSGGAGVAPAVPRPLERPAS